MENAIEDKVTRKKMQIEYKEATQFERSSPSVLAIVGLLNLDVDAINTLWQEAMVL